MSTCWDTTPWPSSKRHCIEGSEHNLITRQAGLARGCHCKQFLLAGPHHVLELIPAFPANMVVVGQSRDCLANIFPPSIPAAHCCSATGQAQGVLHIGCCQFTEVQTFLGNLPGLLNVSPPLFHVSLHSHTSTWSVSKLSGPSQVLSYTLFKWEKNEQN